MRNVAVIVGCFTCRSPELEQLPSGLFECVSCGAVMSAGDLADLADAEVTDEHGEV